MLKTQYENLWQESKFPVLSESCERKLFQRSQGQGILISLYYGQRRKTLVKTLVKPS